MTYSSAIFADPSEPLEAAQHRKLTAILDRTATQAGEEILEIGCGWVPLHGLLPRAGGGCMA